MNKTLVLLLIVLLCLLSSCGDRIASKDIKKKAIINSLEYLKRTKVFSDLNENIYVENNNCHLTYGNDTYSLNLFNEELMSQIKKYTDLNFAELEMSTKEQFHFDLDNYTPCDSSNILFSISEFYQQSLIGTIYCSDLKLSKNDVPKFIKLPYKTEFSYLIFFDDTGQIKKVFETSISY